MIQTKKNDQQNPNQGIEEITAHHNRNPEAILEILRDIQARKIDLSKQNITTLADSLRIPPRSIYGVATFYSMLSLGKQTRGIIRVCNGPVCWMHGSMELKKAIFRNYENNPDWSFENTSCLGQCDRAPAVLVNDNQVGPVTPEEVHLLSSGFLGRPSDYSKARDGEVRVMLKRAGVVDPDSLESALEHGAYAGLRTALQEEPEDVLSEIEASGLSGRGGAGFPVGRKWRFVAQAENYPKYIICNADESEPLIFKDRILIDTDPHQILEGMVLAGYACGSNEAYIYIRGEYEVQALRLEKAITQAQNMNYLGSNILGTNFSFHIHVHRGAGAYICGEETALIESLEGKRGEPRNRPPYPPTSGLHGRPTLVNNVESYAAVPHIISNGSNWFRSLSEYSTPGTKIYMLLGHVNNPGLFEAPFGITLRQAINQFGGGMIPESKFQFALTGGAAGTIVGPDKMDFPIDYASGIKGISLGAGAFLICDQSVSIVAFLRELLRFFSYESCGKCTPCRVGTQRAFKILENVAEGRDEPGFIDELNALAENLFDASFCGLGQSVPIPIRSALLNFQEEFLATKARN